MVHWHSKLAFGLIGIAFGALPIAAGPFQNSAKSNDASAPSPEVQRIAQEVYKQIVTLPQYGVFDNIHFALKGMSTVILRGEASRPTLKSGCANVVKKVEGVKSVVNQIKVVKLP